MEKEKVWIFAIIIAFTIGACIAMKYHQGKLGTVKQANQEAEEIVEETSEQNAFSEESKQHFEDATVLTIEKVARTVVEEEDGSSTTCYETYYVSDVNLKEQTECTEDYAKALDKEEFDDTLVERIPFQEAFDMSFEEKDGWKIYGELLTKNGIDADLTKVKFDEETNQLTGQNLYILEDSNSLLEDMLFDETYDEIIDQKVFYQTMETENGITIPDYFSAIVQYRIGNQKVTKSIYLQVSVNHWEGESYEVD